MIDINTDNAPVTYAHKVAKSQWLKETNTAELLNYIKQSITKLDTEIDNLSTAGDEKILRSKLIEKKTLNKLKEHITTL